MTDDTGAGSDHDRAPGEDAPRPGISKGGAKRRRTASMRVSRRVPPGAGTPGGSDKSAPQRPAGADPRPGQRGWWDSPRVVEFRDFLDSMPGRVLLLSTALAAALLGPLATYSLFAVAYLLRRPLRRAVARLPLGPRTTLGILIVVAGLLRYVLAWAGEYARAAENSTLLHPQLVPGLLIYLGFYTAWALGWGIALVWYRYRLGEVLVIQAGFGIVIEDLGWWLAAGLFAMPQGVLLWLYAMAVSASTLGLAWVLAGDKLASLPDRDTEGAFRYVAPPLLVATCVVAVFTLWGRLLVSAGALPDPVPVHERPFW